MLLLQSWKILSIETLSAFPTSMSPKTENLTFGSICVVVPLLATTSIVSA